MLDSMVHRGPDQDGVWASDQVVLGHRRLSIIDLSDAGRQPMVDAETGLVIVFNGECYNFLELRAELEAKGRRFNSNSDTEVILAAYACWGLSATRRLRGMFALAIWDPRDQTLTLVRDRLGIKPLYFTVQGPRVLFASEVRALLASEWVPRKLDAHAHFAYLWHGFVPGPCTMVDGVSLLEAGVQIRFDSKGRVLLKDRYWSPPVVNESGSNSLRAEDVLHILEKTIHQHLISDVPIGIFLSGGVDSSVIAALAQRHTTGTVSTFNIRFEEARFDESGYARQVARRLGTDHREVTITEKMFESRLDDSLKSLDQPTFDAINTYFVSHAVREAGIKVALAGTGGDELFGGYRTFVDLPMARPWSRTLGLIPARILDPVVRYATGIAAGGHSEVPVQTRWGKLTDLIAARGNLLRMYQVSYGLFTRSLLQNLTLEPQSEMSWGLYPDSERVLADQIQHLRCLPAVSQMELSSFLSERLLRDTDVASMAVSLEVRVPFLDHEFVEALALIPDHLRYHPIRQKQMLRNMVKAELPPNLFDRPKAGFELPLDLWCRQVLAGKLSDTFQDINLMHAIGLNAETVGRIWRSFNVGSPGLHWSRVWSLYVLIDWCRRNRVYR